MHLSFTQASVVLSWLSNYGPHTIHVRKLSYLASLSHIITPRSETSARPLSFLDLPAELRIMVYEYLPNRTVRSEFTKLPANGPASSFALITSSAQTSILATCRTINIEARAIITQKTQRLLEGPGSRLPFARIEADCEALLALSSGYSIFDAIKDYYVLIREERIDAADFDVMFNKAEASVIDHLGLYQSADGQELISRVRKFIRTTSWTLIEHTGRFIAYKSHPKYNEHMSKDYLSWHHPRILVVLIKHPTDTQDLIKEASRRLCNKIGSAQRMQNIHIEILMHDLAIEL